MRAFLVFLRLGGLLCLGAVISRFSAGDCKLTLLYTGRRCLLESETVVGGLSGG